MLSDPGLRCKQGPVVARELVMQLTLLRRHKHWEMFSIIKIAPGNLYGVPVLLHTEIYFHRKWLQQLSPSISEKLRITNARDLFKKPGSVSESNPSDAGSGERGRVQGQSPDLSFNTQDRLNRSVCRRLC